MSWRLILKSCGSTRPAFSVRVRPAMRVADAKSSRLYSHLFLNTNRGFVFGARIHTDETTRRYGYVRVGVRSRGRAGLGIARHRPRDLLHHDIRLAVDINRCVRLRSAFHEDIIILGIHLRVGPILLLVLRVSVAFVGRGVPRLAVSLDDAI